MFRLVNSGRILLNPNKDGENLQVFCLYQCYLPTSTVILIMIAFQPNIRYRR